MRQRKTILRKIDAIKANAIMAPAVYRLFTFLSWKDVPEEYKKFFPEEAESKWDEDLKDYKEEHLILDLDTEIKAVLKALNKRLVIQALSIIPIILADFFVLGNPMDSLQLKLQQATDNYINNLTLVNKEEAESIVMFDIIDILEVIVKKVELDISKNFNKVIIDMSNEYSKYNEQLVNNRKVMEVLGNGKRDAKETDL